MKVVKRKGQTESYDERKIYGSVYAACRAVRMTEEEAESIADRVATAITEWMDGEGDVTSQEILERAAEILKRFHKGAALLYRTHLDVS